MDVVHDLSCICMTNKLLGKIQNRLFSIKAELQYHACSGQKSGEAEASPASPIPTALTDGHF